MLKHRRFVLDTPLDTGQARTVIEQVWALMGIAAIEVEDRQVRIPYALLQVTADRIEAELEAAGAKLGNGWTSILKRGFVHFTEECEVSRLEVGPRFGLHRSSGGASRHG